VAILTAVGVLVVAAAINHVGVPGAAGLSRQQRTAGATATAAGASQGGRISS